MKKNRFLTLIILTLFLTYTSVYAEEISKNDIANGTYIIGSYTFDRENNSLYDGTLKTEHIMLASSSIQNQELSDMLIYFKNSRGKWINPITNTVINDSDVPSKFNIIKHNLLAESYSLKYNSNINTLTGPSSIKMDEEFMINKPTTPIYTVYFDANTQGATIKKDGTNITKIEIETSIFKGFNVTGINKQTAKYNINTTNGNPNPKTWKSLSDESTKILNNSVWFKNLSSTGKEITINANWYPSGKTILPTVTKTGYSCKFNTKADGSGNSYESSAEFTSPSTVGSETLYVICTNDIVSISLYNDNDIWTTIYQKYNDGYYLNSVTQTDNKMTSTTNGVPVPYKYGYEFLGFFIDNTDTKIIDENGYIVSSINSKLWTRNDSNVTLQAKYLKLTPQYGEIHIDKKITGKDLVALQKYLNGLENLNEQQKLNADINIDGEINEKDLQLLRMYILDVFPNTLPDKPITEPIYSITKIIDSEEKIEWVKKNEKMSVYQSKPTKEKYDFKGWYLDDKFTSKFNEDTPITTDITLYAKFEEMVASYGDINQDSEVTKKDLDLLQNYLLGDSKLSYQQKLNADIDASGEVNEKDLVLLKYVISKEISYNELPESAKDFGIDLVLYEIGEGIREHEWVKRFNKISYKPFKEGYMFSGWYGDSELTEEFPINESPLGGVDLYAKFEKIKYGDINEDSRIDGKDLLLLKQYLHGVKTFTDRQKLNADVNNDKEVNEKDLSLLKLYLARVISTSLPNEPITDNIYLVTKMIDSDEESEWVLENKKITNTTPTKEGYNFVGWYTNSNFTKEYNTDTAVTSDITIYAKFEKITPSYGDISLDGKIGTSDLALMRRYLQGLTTLTERQKLNADLNDDGAINEKDLQFLRFAVAGYFSDTLPSKPITTPIYLVTKMIDSDEESEWVLENSKISNTTPTKEGYNFVGWYTDSNYTNKYNTDTVVTDHITLYAKFEKK